MLPMKMLTAIGFAVAAWCAAAIAQSPATGPRWEPQTSGVTARLRGVSAVTERVAWASGATGTVLRTVDGGVTWRSSSSRTRSNSTSATWTP